MKKILLTAALVTLTAGTCFAGISTTKHNLSSGSAAAIKSGNQSQICVFCHTPHNALQNVPLWNRNSANAANTYKLYTSSTTLTTATKAAALHADSQSLFCLSCHDGTIATLASRVNRTGLANNAAIDMSGGAAVWSGAGGTASTGPAMLGQDLTNDHPVGFSYGAAQAADAGLDTATNVKTALGGNTVFFKANAGAIGDSMECSSCHAVHDNTNSPFLRKNNAGSALCLACHLK